MTLGAALSVTQIIEAIVEAISGFLGGFGESINTFFSSVFTETTESTTSISTLGVFLMCMLGVGFGTWLVRTLLGIIRG